jgi:hypothetical protein
MPALGAGISGVTSLIGGFMASSAAKKAAQQQKEAAAAAQKQIDYATGAAVDRGYAGIEQSNNAINTGRDAALKGIAETGTAQKGIYGDMTAGLDPYKAAGTYGLDQLQSKAGTFAFNPKDLENEPGYQFQLQQGMKALQNSAAGRGMLQSGAALKSAIGYEQGLAGTSYQNAYNRALSTFNTNQQGYQTLANLGQTANSQGIQAGGIYGGQLTSLAGLGSNANMQGASLLSNTALQGNEYIGNAQMSGARADADLITGAGNAQAAGTMGSANAWGGALNGVGNAAMMYGLSKMKNGGGGSGNYGFGGNSGYTPGGWYDQNPLGG